MQTDPQNEKPATGEDPNSWLVQFYTSSKTTGQTDFADAAETGTESPAAQLSTTPAEKYKITDELGTGGMKLVRRTLDKNAARDVALAVMLDPSPRSKKVSRFIREARITAALEHPNIVPIYDIGVDEAGKPYFTMKLLGGETLHTILQKINEGNAEYRKRYPLSRLLQIFLGVCNAVGFAHSRGVIHLDLKPANIQVGDFGEVLVLDWGLAKVIEKDPAKFPHRLVLGEGLREMPSEGVVRGTPGFMGPEQSRGEYASLNEFTDIFALGAVLYTILKCKTPLKKDAPKAKSPAAFKSPPALEAVTTKAMARQPMSRYQTVEELAGDVQAFVDGYATKAQQAGAVTLLWLLIKRHNVVTSLLGISLILIFSAFAVSYIRVRESERAAVASEAVEEAALKRIKTEQDSKRRLSLLAAPRVFQQAENMIHVIDYDQAVSTLEYAVTLDNDFQQAWWELGALRLGRQDFDIAVMAFEHATKDADSGKNNRRLEDLAAVARKYAAIARGAGGTLPREREQEFVDDILHADRTSWQNRLNALGAFFKNKNRNTDTVNFEVIEHTLRMMNPEAKDLEFSHQMTDTGLKVALHGDKVNQIMPLTGLPVSILDLSEAGSVDLNWVRDMPLIKVDLSWSRFGDLLALTKITTLTELRLVGSDKDIGRLRTMNQLKRIVVSTEDVAEIKKAMENRSFPPPAIVGE